MQIGDRIGDYEIVKIIGAGGMGQVYKVQNTLSERVEAMKVALANLEGNQEALERFQREIKLQAALDHPNIAKLYTAMRHGNQLLMFMEFVEGTALQEKLKPGPLPLAVAAEYVTVSFCLPATTDVMDGAPGMPHVAADNELDSAPSPAVFTARTFTRYVVPSSKPEIEIGAGVGGGVHHGAKA